MGFLANIFKTKELVYLEQLYKDTKQDKQALEFKLKTLEEENKTLKEELFAIKLNSLQINKKPLSLRKREEFVYHKYLKLDKQLTLKQFAKLVKLKESSLKVYISRIKNKTGDEITLK